MEGLRYQVRRLKLALRHLEAIDEKAVTVPVEELRALQSALAYAEAIVRRSAVLGKKNSPAAAVSPADTLASVAAATGLTLHDVRAHNPQLAALADDDVLPPNILLRLPVRAAPSSPLHPRKKGEKPRERSALSAAHGAAAAATTSPRPPPVAPAPTAATATSSSSPPTTRDRTVTTTVAAGSAAASATDPSAAVGTRPSVSVGAVRGDSAGRPSALSGAYLRETSSGRPAGSTDFRASSASSFTAGQAPDSPARLRSPDYYSNLVYGHLSHDGSRGSSWPPESSTNGSLLSGPPPWAPMPFLPGDAYTFAPEAADSAGSDGDAVVAPLPLFSPLQPGGEPADGRTGLTAADGPREGSSDRARQQDRKRPKGGASNGESSAPRLSSSPSPQQPRPSSPLSPSPAAAEETASAPAALPASKRKVGSPPPSRRAKASTKPHQRSASATTTAAAVLSSSAPADDASATPCAAAHKEPALSASPPPSGAAAPPSMSASALSHAVPGVTIVTTGASTTTPSPTHSSRKSASRSHASTQAKSPSRRSTDGTATTAADGASASGSMTSRRSGGGVAIITTRHGSGARSSSNTSSPTRSSTSPRASAAAAAAAAADDVITSARDRAAAVAAAAAARRLLSSSGSVLEETHPDGGSDGRTTATQSSGSPRRANRCASASSVTAASAPTSSLPSARSASPMEQAAEASTEGATVRGSYLLRAPRSKEREVAEGATATADGTTKPVDQQQPQQDAPTSTRAASASKSPSLSSCSASSGIAVSSISRNGSDSRPRAGLGCTNPEDLTTPPRPTAGAKYRQREGANATTAAAAGGGGGGRAAASTTHSTPRAKGCDGATGTAARHGVKEGEEESASDVGNDDEDEDEDEPTPCSTVPASLTGYFHANKPAIMAGQRQRQPAAAGGEAGKTSEEDRARRRADKSSAAQPPAPRDGQSGGSASLPAPHAPAQPASNDVAAQDASAVSLPADLSTATSSTYVSGPPSFLETSPPPRAQAPPPARRRQPADAAQAQSALASTHTSAVYSLHDSRELSPSAAAPGTAAAEESSASIPAAGQSQRGRSRMLEKSPRRRSHSAPSSPSSPERLPAADSAATHGGAVEEHGCGGATAASVPRYPEVENESNTSSRVDRSARQGSHETSANDSRAAEKMLAVKAAAGGPARPDGAVKVADADDNEGGNDDRTDDDDEEAEDDEYGEDEYDTIAGIAAAYSVSVADVLQWNPYLGVYLVDEPLPADLPIVLPMPADGAEAPPPANDPSAAGHRTAEDDTTPVARTAEAATGAAKEEEEEEDADEEEQWIEETPSPTPVRPQ